MKVEELNKDERMEDARNHSLTEWSLRHKTLHTTHQHKDKHNN